VFLMFNVVGLRSDMLASTTPPLTAASALPAPNTAGGRRAAAGGRDARNTYTHETPNVATACGAWVYRRRAAPADASFLPHFSRYHKLYWAAISGFVPDRRSRGPAPDRLVVNTCHLLYPLVAQFEDDFPRCGKIRWATVQYLDKAKRSRANTTLH